METTPGLLSHASRADSPFPPTPADSPGPTPLDDSPIPVASVVHAEVGEPLQMLTDIRAEVRRLHERLDRLEPYLPLLERWAMLRLALTSRFGGARRG